MITIYTLIHVLCSVISFYMMVDVFKFKVMAQVLMELFSTGCLADFHTYVRKIVNVHICAHTYISIYMTNMRPYFAHIYMYIYIHDYRISTGLVLNKHMMKARFYVQIATFYVYIRYCFLFLVYLAWYLDGGAVFLPLCV